MASYTYKKVQNELVKYTQLVNDHQLSVTVTIKVYPNGQRLEIIAVGEDADIALLKILKGE